jgi:hypothetical protein
MRHALRHRSAELVWCQPTTRRRDPSSARRVRAFAAGVRADQEVRSALAAPDQTSPTSCGDFYVHAKTHTVSWPLLLFRAAPHATLRAVSSTSSSELTSRPAGKTAERYVHRGRQREERRARARPRRRKWSFLVADRASGGALAPAGRSGHRCVCGSPPWTGP